jgi:uncharacterized membrane protein
MEFWIQYYVSFAVSGALVAWWCIFLPSLQLLCHETDGDHPVLRSRFISGVVWFGISLLAIPILIYPILHDRSRVNFIIGLTQGFLHKS